MKKLFIVFLGIFMWANLFAQLSPDYDLLILNRYDFPEEEIGISRLEHHLQYEQWTEIPGMYSKGQTGLLMLDMLAAADTLTDAVFVQEKMMFDAMMEVSSGIHVFQESFYAITDSVNDQYDLIDNLYEFMSEGRDDSLIMLMDSLRISFEDLYYSTMDHIYMTGGKLSVLGDSIATRADTIIKTNEPFAFRVGEVWNSATSYDSMALDTAEMFTIYNETFQTVYAAANYLEDAVNCFAVGMDEITDMETAQQPGVDTLRKSFQALAAAFDTLNNFSMYSFLDSTDLAYLKDAMIEADSLLAGKEYMIDGTVAFVPVEIINNMPYGLYRTYVDVYTAPDPYSYDFRGVFPAGLPAEFIEQIQPDMVLDLRYSRTELESYLGNLGTTYAARAYLDPSDIDAQVGLGYLQIFDMIQDMTDQGKMILALAENGRIDSLFMNYDWTHLDYTQEVNIARMQLSKHLEAANNGNYTVYTILVKDPNRASFGSEIVAGDIVYPVHIVPEVSDGIVSFTYAAEEAVEDMKTAADYLYTKVDSLVDIDLDPNSLNLEGIEEPLDLIYAFEAANPNFLAFTPKGKAKFQELGMMMADGMMQMCVMNDTMMATMAYAENLMYEFGMSEADYDSMMADMGFANDMMHMMAADMEIPEAYTVMNGTTMNMSAWFDEVPDNMLTVMKNYYEGTDSSMAGFFPDYIVEENVNPLEIPAEFSLKQNYPNPFNPVTHIEFDLPEKSDATLSIYDVTGRCVETMISNEFLEAGNYKVTWNAATKPSGIYFVRLQAGNTVATNKMTLLK